MAALSDPTMADAMIGASLETDPGTLEAAGEGLRETVAEEGRRPLGVPSPGSQGLSPADEEPEDDDRSRRRPVHGRYRSTGTGFQLELRVDVGGARPLKKASGDFFAVSGGTVSYAGSFVIHAPTVSVTKQQVRLEGLGAFTFTAGAPHVKITIPRRRFSQPPGKATVEFFTTAGSPGATYLCAFVSSYFRSLLWEQDSVAGAVPFVSYDTGSLPQPAGSPARVLTVPKAFAEAGLQLQVSTAPNVIDTSAAGPNAKWSDAELHAAMVNHFSVWQNAPLWQSWLLVATSHEGGFRGIMFDYADAFQRQGCAVFHDAIQGTDAASQRAQLRTYVHELGHAFNLLHSWQKNLADPPQPLGPNGGLGDLSWMNYTWKYQPPPPEPGGEAAYWAAFPFAFTDNELGHLRHGFYQDVIMGGNRFGKGAAEIDPAMFDAPIVDDSRLALDLRGRTTFEFGEPVVVELKLSTTDLRGQTAHGYLHPNNGLVSIAIRQPSGRTVLYRPLLPRCVDETRTVQLDGTQPAIYQSAYIGYGRDGHTFQQPGSYELRAQYVANDGSRIVSPVLRVQVRPPLSRADQEVAELLMGDEQGQIFYLLGSDSAHLKAGNEALERVLEHYADHPLAIYPRLAKGINAERDFKSVPPGEAVLQVRPADPTESVKQLSRVVDASSNGEGVDNVTLNLVMRRLARAEAKAGSPEKAAQVMDQMVEVFAKKGLNTLVLRRIRKQAEATKVALTGEDR
jgi:hypothetical protein